MAIGEARVGLSEGLRSSCSRLFTFAVHISKFCPCPLSLVHLLVLRKKPSLTVSRGEAVEVKEKKKSYTFLCSHCGRWPTVNTVAEYVGVTEVVAEGRVAAVAVTRLRLLGPRAAPSQDP